MFTRPVKLGETLSLNIPGEELGEETLFPFEVEIIVCSRLIVARKIRKDAKTLEGGKECLKILI
jgi:hypothetical protein